MLLLSQLIFPRNRCGFLLGRRGKPWSIARFVTPWPKNSFEGKSWPITFFMDLWWKKIRSWMWNDLIKLRITEACKLTSILTHLKLFLSLNPWSLFSWYTIHHHLGHLITSTLLYHLYWIHRYLLVIDSNIFLFYTCEGQQPFCCSSCFGSVEKCQ